jgi:hypothetical protein
MIKAEAKAQFAREWSPWQSTIAAIDPDRTREPGVCGAWTLHDVVGHVQSYARYRLTGARAAFSHVVPTDVEVYGERTRTDPVDGSLDARNEAIRLSGLELTWQALVDESEWLAERTVAFLESQSPAELDEPLGWVPFWDPDFPREPGDDLRLHVRRVSEVPAATDPVPAWQFVQPDVPDGHTSAHLAQITTWMAGSGPLHRP